MLKLLHLSLGLEEHSRLTGIDVAAHNEGQMGLAFPVSVNTTHGWLPWSREVVRVAALVEAAASTKRLRTVMVSTSPLYTTFSPVYRMRGLSPKNRRAGLFACLCVAVLLLLFGWFLTTAAKKCSTKKPQ